MKDFKGVFVVVLVAFVVASFLVYADADKETLQMAIMFWFMGGTFASVLYAMRKIILGFIHNG